MLLATKLAISIKLATTLGFFFLRELDLDFANVYIMACPTCYLYYPVDKTLFSRRASSFNGGGGGGRRGGGGLPS